jgi:hypothetical protein
MEQITMRQLVISWVTAQKAGYRTELPAAIEALNRECGINVTHSRLAEWRAGKYTPSQKVLSHMLYSVLPWALREVGLQATEAQLDALEELIWAVTVKDGERQIELL